MKKALFFLTTFVIGMAIMPNVYADDCTDIEDPGKLGSALKTCPIVTLKQGASINTNDMLTVDTVNVVLDLNGATITRANVNGNTVITVTSGKTLEIKDSRGTGKVVYSGFGNSETKALAIDGEGTLTVKGGSFIADTGIGLWGADGKLNFEGGTINAKQNAINSNGAHASESTINISGGTIQSTEGAAIYMPQSGTLNITNGNLIGYVGIVSRGGEVKLSGGTIKAIGTSPVQIGDANVQFPGGVAVIIDTKTLGYTGGANAVIGAGTTINATNTNPILAYNDDENESNSIVVNAGVQFIGSYPKDVYLSEGLIVGGDGKVVDPNSVKPVENMDNIESPNTSDIDLFRLISLIVLSGLGLGYTVKEIAFN